MKWVASEVCKQSKAQNYVPSLPSFFVTRAEQKISKEFLICFFCSTGHKKIRQWIFKKRVHTGVTALRKLSPSCTLQLYTIFCVKDWKENEKKFQKKSLFASCICTQARDYSNKRFLKVKKTPCLLLAKMKSQEGGLLLIACLQAFVTLIAAQVSIEQQRRKKVQHFVHTAVWYCSKTRLLVSCFPQ
mgnify:CR=1 FL=1